MSFNFLNKTKGLSIISDRANWSLDHDARELKVIAQNLGYQAEIIRRSGIFNGRALHYTDQFRLLDRGVFTGSNKLSFDYYHGNPESDRIFKDCFEALKKNHNKISRLRVSNKAMKKIILSSGIDRGKVFRIPIGVNLAYFSPAKEKEKNKKRKALGLPEEAFVVGSFQKDGSGWGEGLEPKMVKGPDIFLQALAELKKNIPNLWVLLSGPARGFVMKGLEELGIPFRHVFLKNYPEVAELYKALDVYLVASREEGGPKALLESLASGVPLVSSMVGQAPDILTSGEDCILTPVGDCKQMAEGIELIYRNEKFREKLITNGIKTATRHSYREQESLWREYFKDFVKK